MISKISFFNGIFCLRPVLGSKRRCSVWGWVLKNGDGQFTGCMCSDPHRCLCLVRCCVANAMGKPSVLREPKGARKGREGAQSGVIKRGGNSITWEVDQPF